MESLPKQTQIHHHRRNRRIGACLRGNQLLVRFQARICAAVYQFGDERCRRRCEQPVKSFGEFLIDSLKKANELELESEKLNAALAAGRIEDISQVVVASQKAEIALQLTLQLRNRATQAYQEIMRMQV